MPRLTIDGNELDYEQRGTGEDVVLVHGFGATRESWTALMDLLARDFRVTAYSQRGFPPSSEVADPADVSMPLLVSDLAAVLDALEIERAHLVGSSMGSGVVRIFVLEQSDRVRSAVLDGGHGGGPVPRPADADGPAIEAICAAAQQDMGGLADRWCSAPHFGSLRRKDPQAWQAFRDRFAAMPVSTVLNVQRGIRGRGDRAWISPEELATITTPTLVLFGDQDVPAVSGSLFNAAAIPSAGLAVLPGCGHHGFVEEPELYASVVGAFLRSAGAGDWRPPYPRPHLAALVQAGAADGA